MLLDVDCLLLVHKIEQILIGFYYYFTKVLTLTTLIYV